MRSIEKFNDLIGIWTRNLPAWSILPQTTTLSCAPNSLNTYHLFSFSLLFYPEDGGRKCLRNVLNDPSRLVHSATCQTTVSTVRNVDPIKCSFPRELWWGGTVVLIEIIWLLKSVLYILTMAFLYPEDGGSRCLRNVGNGQISVTVLHQDSDVEQYVAIIKVLDFIFNKK
jgi:hypothetical protein